MEQGQIIQFGSVWGSLITLGFFILITLVIGIGTGRILIKHLAAGATGAGISGKVLCMAFGVSLASGLLAILYATTLSGYQRMELQGETVIVQYAIPPGTRVFSRSEIVNIGVSQSTGEQAQLVIELIGGERLYSARDNRMVVEQGRQSLTTRTVPSTSRKRRPFQ